MSDQRNTAHTHSQPAEKSGCTSTRSTTVASGARSTTKDVNFIANVSPGSITAIPGAPSATNTSAPSTPATPAKSDRRRAEIIAAARELYEEQGLSHTTVQDITARVGVTRSLFYHYFADKEAVTSAVLDDYIADYLEALSHWNASRREGDIDHALATIVRLLRIGVFENDSFRLALASRENAALYLEFVNRVADHTANYILETTVRDYAELHEVRIHHLYETFYVLILGVIGYLRQHPDADDQVIADVIAQTLYLDRP